MTKNAENSGNVTGKILAFIKDRRFEPGERLPSEREFAERFRTSRGAIREAMAILESIRVIERRPNSGIFLRNLATDSSFESLVLHATLGLPLSESEMAHSLEVRYVLERQAIRLACKRRTPEDLVAMRSVLAETEAQIEAGKTIQEQDEAFHLAVVAATGNSVFVRVVNAFYLLSRSRRQVYFSDLERCRQSYEEHRTILAAIEAGDVRLGLATMKKHVDSAKGLWLSSLDVASRPVKRPA